jgi:hypothetical protein
MMRKISSVIGHKWDVKQRVDEGSAQISDQTIIEEFIANPDNTFLVTFPRTGSHWLRMLMEIYFEQPSLVRLFYYPENRDFLTLHTHDLDLDVERSHVIYLYRDPVDTIFSQLYYHGETLNDRNRIVYWSDLYSRHLDKWLHHERFTSRKTILTYEGMREDLAAEFIKITEHFGRKFDKIRLEQSAKLISKETVKQKTRHDKKTVQLNNFYEVQREDFRKLQGSFVWGTLINDRPYLVNYFADIPRDKNGFWK